MKLSLRLAFIALIVLMAVGLVQLKAHNAAMEQAAAGQGAPK
ncbi:MAG: hypothetical protein AB1730_02495 [Myxococcota bacterium]|jgi:hypothetical protein